MRVRYIREMKRSKFNAPRITSYAAPTEADRAVFDELSPGEKREAIKAEIEGGLCGSPRKVTAEDIIAVVDARLADA